MVVYKESHLIKTRGWDNNTNNMTKQQVCGVGHFDKQKERGGVCARPTKVAVVVWGAVASASPPPPFHFHWLYHHVIAAVTEEEKGRGSGKKRKGKTARGQSCPSDYQPIRRCPVLSWR